MTFCAVVCSHANERGLRNMLACLRYQTRKPDRIIALCSDTPGLARLREDFPDVEFVAVENENDWGHSKRDRGIELAAEDWVGFFNDDDEYEAVYLERMLARAGDADVVWCGWNEQPGCDFSRGHSTAGNFIVSTALAKRVGWSGRHYEADGVFIDRLASLGVCVKVDEVLYHHNEGVNDASLSN